MTAHILDPFRALVRAMRPAPRPKPDPLPAFLDGLTIPEELIGKHFNITDTEGRIVASTRRPIDPRIAGMLG